MELFCPQWKSQACELLCDGFGPISAFIGPQAADLGAGDWRQRWATVFGRRRLSRLTSLTTPPEWECCV